MNNRQEIEEEFEDLSTSHILEAAKENYIVRNNMILAAKIIKAIRSKGWNNTQFAEAMGIKNNSIVSKWLSGTNNFQANTLYKIEKVLSINLIDLSEAHKESIVSEVVLAKSYVFSTFDEALYNSGGISEEAHSQLMVTSGYFFYENLLKEQP